MRGSIAELRAGRKYVSALLATAAERPEDKETKEESCYRPLRRHEGDDAERELIQKCNPPGHPREACKEADTCSDEQRATPNMGPRANTLAK